MPGHVRICDFAGTSVSCAGSTTEVSDVKFKYHVNGKYAVQRGVPYVGEYRDHVVSAAAVDLEQVSYRPAELVHPTTTLGDASYAFRASSLPADVVGDKRPINRSPSLHSFLPGILGCGTAFVAFGHVEQLDLAEDYDEVGV